MSWKKVVNRNVAIGLGIICIILIAGLVGIFAYYWMQVNTLNDQKNNLNTIYQDYSSTHSHSNSEYDALVAYKNRLETWLAGNITQLQGQINSLQSIVYLNVLQPILDRYTINQGAGAQSHVTSFQSNYAGYVWISLTSTTTNAYVTVEYWYKDSLFSFRKTLGTSGEAFFCVLPSSVAIYVGNSNWLNGATHTITATYHY